MLPGDPLTSHGFSVMPAASGSSSSVMIRAVSAVVATILALVVSSSTHAATTYRRDIAIEPVKVPTLIAVELDERVYAHTDGLPEEARVYSAAGRSVGFVIQDVRGRQVSKETISWPGTVTRAEATGDGPLVIECTSPAKQPWPGSMVIETPLVDFQQLVRTEVQLADGTWGPAAEETLLADYSRFVNIRQNEITLKQPEAAMAAKGPWTFRLTILQPTPEVESRLKQIVQREGSDGASSRETRTVVDQRPFKINAIRFEAKVEKEGPEEVLTVDWVPPMSKTVHGLTGKSTVTFIAGSRPVNELSLEIAGTNFSRTARFIAYRENEAQPSRRQDVTLRKIDIGNLHRDETRLIFSSPIIERMLQFEIDDQSDPPL
ncbi:MAG: hypothetical protein C0478_13630, partial [Planctomyces sp.]|nr:hypothetical protein [Planctomyces sp.]